MSILPQSAAKRTTSDPEIAESSRALQARRSEGDPLTPKSQGITSISEIAGKLVRPDLAGPGDIDSKDPTTPKSQGFRFWIKVCLRGKYADVERILVNWKLERQQAPRLANAIRLYDAILRGDRDTVREIAPLLMPEPAAPSAQKKRRPSPPVLDSSSKIESVEDKIRIEEVQELFEAILEVTGSDYRVNKKTWDIGLRLHAAGYGAAEVFGFRRWFQTKEWKGRDKGEMPTIRDLEERIALSRGWRDTGNPYEDDPAHRRDLEILDRKHGIQET